MNQTKPTELFILGAGASVPYGIPAWQEIHDIVEQMVINERSKENYNNEQLGHMDKFLQFSTEFSTIDEAIWKYAFVLGDDENAFDFEDIVFSFLATHFKRVDYQRRVVDAEDNRWLQQLFSQGKAMNFADPFMTNKVFVNFNYDRILQTEVQEFRAKCLALHPDRVELAQLQAEYDLLTGQNKEVINSDDSDILDSVINGKAKELHAKKEIVNRLDEKERDELASFADNIFYPHGFFGMTDDTRVKVNRGIMARGFSPDYLLGHGTTYISRRVFGDRSGFEGRATALRMTAIIPQDAKPTNAVMKIFRDRRESYNFEHVYVIGLGAGLEPNLSKLGLEEYPIKSLTYTCLNNGMAKQVKMYLRQQLGDEVTLTRYRDCSDFIENYHYLA